MPADPSFQELSRNSTLWCQFGPISDHFAQKGPNSDHSTAKSDHLATLISLAFPAFFLFLGQLFQHLGTEVCGFKGFSFGSINLSSSLEKLRNFLQTFLSTNIFKWNYWYFLDSLKEIREFHDNKHHSWSSGNFQFNCQIRPGISNTILVFSISSFSSLFDMSLSSSVAKSSINLFSFSLVSSTTFSPFKWPLIHLVRTCKPAACSGKLSRTVKPLNAFSLWSSFWSLWFS